MSSSTIASAATNGEEPPSKKKAATEPTPIPSLPDDLVVTCLARVSRLHYPTLSLVSKSFRSLLASPELYQTRSLLNRTESCLYVCFRFPSEANPRWFTLSRKPDKIINNHNSKKTKKKKESSGNLLVPISFLSSPPVKWSNLVAVGHNLYAICAPIENAPCTSVSMLDCRTHTWLEAPSLRVAYTDSEYDRLPFCRIENIIILFYKSSGVFVWADTKLGGGLRGKLEGLQGLPKFARYSTVKLVDYGGKMLVLWDKHVPASGYKEKMIWCAVISLEKRNNEEIWGKVEWFDAVLTVPKSYIFGYAIAATV